MASNTTLIGGIVIALLIGGLIGYSIQPAQEVKEVTVPGTSISVRAEGEAIWIFPGKRKLDPELFGTPQNPLKTNWVPLEMREVSEDNNSFTTTVNVTPFSDSVEMITGTISLSVKDVTPVDDAASKDEAVVEATFTDPTGENTYTVVVQDVIPVGVDHQFFGGVGTDVYIHGVTEIGSPLVPTVWNYVVLWGIGELYKNGELIDTMRMVHVMVSQRIRDDTFQVGFDVAYPDKYEVHVMLPPVKVTPEGPVDSPVPTGVFLPTGVEQPFIHVNFYSNITVEGDRFLETGAAKILWFFPFFSFFMEY